MKCYCGSTAYYNFKGLPKKLCYTHKETGMINLCNKICESEDCVKLAKFNFSGQTKKFCNIHKQDGMVNLSYKKTCKESGCGKYPNYNLNDQKTGLFCKTHKTPEMVDVVHKLCEFDGCEKQPNYNFKGEKKGRFCDIHKQDRMINIITKTCQEVGCDTLPSYNLSNSRIPKFCVIHKKDGMIPVIGKKCEFINCNERAYYNVKGKKTPLYCPTHKQDGMILVTNKKCEMDGCDISPSYNFYGEIVPRFCTTHKEDGMINIKDKCEARECGVKASYNINGKKTARFCFSHKEDGMINVNCRLCKSEECQRLAIYHLPAEKNNKFCSIHKEDGMNILYKICDKKNCESRSRYGWLGKPYTRCGLHKEKGMVSFSKRKCSISKCNRLGTFEEDEERYCETHKTEHAVNLGIDKCTLCGLEDILVDGKCDTCDPSVVKIRYKAKENRVKEVLISENIDFIHNRILESSICGTEKPDFQIDCKSHFIYVEVDENQHDSYACECEQIRMNNLVLTRGMPVTFIRYNPDIYEPVSKQQVINKRKREQILVENIRYAMKHSPLEQGVYSNVLYLFYDGYDTKQPEWHVLM